MSGFVKGFALAAAFALLPVVQLLPSATLAWQQTQRLHHGQPVRLAVETRDPRDLFRGEYSVLAYEIGRLRGVAAPVDGPGCDLSARESCPLTRDRRVYLRLAPDAAGIHRADEVRFEPPTEGGPFIVGRLGSATLVRRGASIAPGRGTGTGANARPDPAVCEHAACLSGSVRYGIENWYGPQGVPRTLDRVAREEVLVEARVADDGAAVIDGILVGGQPFAKTARLW